MSTSQRAIRLLLFSNRPVISMCFSQLERLGNHTLQVSSLPMSLKELENSSNCLGEATLIAFDIVPDPVEALHMCEALQQRGQDVPLLGVICCNRQLHPSH